MEYVDAARSWVDDQVAAITLLWENKRQLSFSVLNLAMIVFSALMLWKGVIAFTNSESPVVVVLRCAHCPTG